MSGVVEHPEDYFRQLVPTREPLLEALEKEALEEGIPIVGPVVGQLLCILARAVHAGRILELGTAIGYSAIFMARAFEYSRGQLVSIERDPKMADRARKNIRKAELERWVDVRVGDAVKEMKQINDPFDLVFLDIDKSQYEPVLSHCRRLLRPGGLLVADNVAFPEADDFNRRLAGAAEWKSVSLFGFFPQHSPERDGLCLAVRL
jgi:caffeoyl-CoA O-methyltransferase